MNAPEPQELSPEELAFMQMAMDALEDNQVWAYIKYKTHRAIKELFEFMDQNGLEGIQLFQFSEHGAPKYGAVRFELMEIPKEKDEHGKVEDNNDNNESSGRSDRPHY